MDIGRYRLFLGGGSPPVTMLPGLAPQVDSAHRYNYCCCHMHVVDHERRLAYQNGKSNPTENSFVFDSGPGKLVLYRWCQSGKDAGGVLYIARPERHWSGLFNFLSGASEATGIQSQAV